MGISLDGGATMQDPPPRAAREAPNAEDGRVLENQCPQPRPHRGEVLDALADLAAIAAMPHRGLNAAQIHAFERRAAHEWR